MKFKIKVPVEEINAMGNCKLFDLMVKFWMSRHFFFNAIMFLLVFSRPRNYAVVSIRVYNQPF